jgi:hypothetical protein
MELDKNLPEFMSSVEIYFVSIPIYKSSQSVCSCAQGCVIFIFHAFLKVSNMSHRNFQNSYFRKNIKFGSLAIAASDNIAIIRVESFLLAMLFYFLRHKSGHLVCTSAVELREVARACTSYNCVAYKPVRVFSSRHSVLLEMDEVVLFG